MRSYPLASRILMTLRENRGDLCRGLVAFSSAAVFGAIPPVATGYIFGSVVPLGHALGEWSLFWLGGGLLWAVFAGGMLERFGSLCWLRTENRLQSRWGAEAWARVVSLPSKFYREKNSSEIVERGMATQKVFHLLAESAPRLQAALAMALVNLWVMLVIDPLMALAGGGCAGGALAFLLIFGKHRGRRKGASPSQLLHEASEWIRGADSLRLSQGWWAVNRRMSHLLSEQFKTQREAGWRDGLRSSLFTGATALPALILFAISDQTDLEIGAFLAFLVAFGGLVGSLRVIADLWPGVGELRTLAEAARPVWEADETATVPPKESHSFRGGLSLDEVTFRYDPDSAPVLHRFSLAVAPGERVLIVGPSGSGKSTLLRLITGLEMPESGRIRWDGRELAGRDLDCLRGEIGVVWQRGLWVPGSVLSNIVGEAELSLEAAWHAAEIAGIADEIRKLPMGMQTIVAEGGENFSAGERQRLRLARALARKPRLLLLDNAMSALDTPMLSHLLESIAKTDATCLIVSHRNLTHPAIDRVLTLESRD